MEGIYVLMFWNEVPFIVGNAYAISYTTGTQSYETTGKLESVNTKYLQVSLDCSDEFNSDVRKLYLSSNTPGYSVITSLEDLGPVE